MPFFFTLDLVPPIGEFVPLDGLVGEEGLIRLGDVLLCTAPSLCCTSKLVDLVPLPLGLRCKEVCGLEGLMAGLVLLDIELVLPVGGVALALER